MHNTDAEFVLRANDERHHPVVPFARFLSFETGGAWVRAARKAYCLIKGDGIWLPPALPQDVEPRMDPVPALGQHTEHILSSLGFAPAAIERLRSAGVV